MLTPFEQNLTYVVYLEGYTISDSILNRSRPVCNYSKAGIMCSNFSRGMDYVSAFPCLYSPVSVLVMGRHAVQEQCNASNECIIPDLIMNLNKPECLLRATQATTPPPPPPPPPIIIIIIIIPQNFFPPKKTVRAPNSTTIKCIIQQHRVYIYPDQLCQHCHTVTATGDNTCSCVHEGLLGADSSFRCSNGDCCDLCQEAIELY